MFKECTESLPLGDIDVVAGRVDNSSKINWSFGIQILAENEGFQLESPIGVSAKTQRTLATAPPSKSFCIVRVNVHTTTNFCSIDTPVETLAFTKVLESKDAKRLFCRYVHK